MPFDQKLRKDWRRRQTWSTKAGRTRTLTNLPIGQKQTSTGQVDRKLKLQEPLLDRTPTMQELLVAQRQMKAGRKRRWRRADQRRTCCADRKPTSQAVRKQRLNSWTALGQRQRRL